MYLRGVDSTMSQRLNKARSAMEKQFAPEADGPFEEVSEQQIAEMREKIDAAHGIGSGRIKCLDKSFLVE